MKKTLLSISGIFTLLLFTSAEAQVIDDTSGGNGTLTGVGQSYNESRAMDVTVLSAVPVHITSMTIKYLNSGADNTVMLGTRVFNTSNMASVFSHDTTLSMSMINATIIVPVSYTLLPGESYRIGFFCGGPNQDNSAGMYHPTFPYNESHNLLQINAGKEAINDVYPNNMNIYIPVMNLNYILTTGIDFINPQENTLSLFPNPFNDELTVTTTNNLPQHICIYDVSSRKCMEQQFDAGTTINTDQLSKGVYFYQVTTTDGFIKTGKLVKN